MTSDHSSPLLQGKTAEDSAVTDIRTVLEIATGVFALLRSVAVVVDSAVTVITTPIDQWEAGSDQATKTVSIPNATIPNKIRPRTNRPIGAQVAGARSDAALITVTSNVEEIDILIMTVEVETTIVQAKQINKVAGGQQKRVDLLKQTATLTMVIGSAIIDSRVPPPRTGMTRHQTGRTLA